VLERRGGGAFIAPQGNLAIGVPETWTCPGQGLNMSSQPLWNPATEPDKVERPDMSGFGAEHARPESLKSD
jgi:hypothetical protein